MIRDFLQRAAIEISFGVRWSLVAQAVPENEPFLQKMSIFRNRYVHTLFIISLYKVPERAATMAVLISGGNE